jgi:outer membrane protein assembly factor BamB
MISADGLARQWPESGPRVLWECAVGSGFAGPAVVGDEVFLLDRQDSARDVLRCLDFKTGKELWSVGYDAPARFSYDGSRSTPSVDAENVFTVGPLGQLTCVSRAEKKIVWSKNLLEEFDAKRPTWVVAQSPLLYKDMVIVAPQGTKAGVVAFRKATGETVWQSAPVSSAMSYASPLLTTLGGVDQVVILSGKAPKGTTVTGVDATTGDTLWQYNGGWQCSIPITSPVFIGDGRIFITGEYGAGSAMIRVAKEGDAWKVDELYLTKVCGAQLQQPLLYEGYLYMNSNGNKRRDGFACIDLDGNLKWKTDRNPNFERGPMIMASGLIYAMNGRTGDLALIEPSPEKFNLLCQAKVFDTEPNRKGGKQAWGPMALVDGKLLLRDQNTLKCLDVSAE